MQIDVKHNMENPKLYQLALIYGAMYILIYVCSTHSGVFDN